MFCRNCGTELGGVPEVCFNCGARPLMGDGFCWNCGGPTSVHSEVCVRCGASLSREAETKSGGGTAAVTVGGVLTIILGVLGVMGGGLNILDGLIGFGGSVDAYSGVSTGITVVVGFFEIALGAVAIIGGVYAVQKKKFPLAIIGAVCGILATGCCGFPIGIPAVILIAISKDKFEK